MKDHTFVITVYKESPYLEACIKSLVGQTAKSKVIIATSTPSNYSQAIAAAYNIPYFINNTDNKSIANNWNYALSIADTRLVTVAHQDDIYRPDFAEELIKKVSKYDKGDMLIAFTNYTDVVNGIPRTSSLNAVVKNILLSPFLFSSSINKFWLKKMILMLGNPICCPTVTFNMHKMDGFGFSDEYKCMLDWYAWYQIAQKKGSFLYVDKKLIDRRLHLDSGTTHLINNGEKREYELKMFELMWGKIPARLIARIYALSYKDNLV